jgi:hypothetical protein
MQADGMRQLKLLLSNYLHKESYRSIREQAVKDGSHVCAGTYIEALGFEVEGIRIVAKTYADDSARMISTPSHQCHSVHCNSTLMNSCEIIIT